MMTPQSKLPTFLKPVRQRPSTFPKERKLKQEKQQQIHQEALKAVLDLHADKKNGDEDLSWNQSAMQTDNEKVKRQRQTIFEKFRSAPNSPLLPSFMLAAPQRISSPSSPLASGGAPIRITSLGGSGSALARMAASNVAQPNVKISDLVSSTKTSVQSHRKTAKRSSLEKRARIRQRVHVRMHQSTSPSIPSASGLSFMFTGKK